MMATTQTVPSAPKARSRAANARPLVALALAAVALPLIAATQPANQSANQSAVKAANQPAESGVYQAVSRPSDMRELGFAARGRVGELLVKPGDKVTKGQMLMRLDDSVQRQAVAMYTLEAEDLSKIKQAEVALTFREEDLRITKDSLARGGAGANDLRESQFRRDTAEIELAQAKHQHLINQQMLRREQAQLEQMAMTAPFDGTVLEIKKRPGEIVEENTQALTVVTTDPLWIDVNVPTREAVKIGVGQGATVTWEDLDNAEPMSGKVVFISPYGHGGARQIQVRVEVANPKGIPTGLHGVVRFGAPQAAGTPPGTGQTAAKGGSAKPNP